MSYYIMLFYINVMLYYIMLYYIDVILYCIILYITFMLYYILNNSMYGDIKSILEKS